MFFDYNEEVQSKHIFKFFSCWGENREAKFWTFKTSEKAWSNSLTFRSEKAVNENHRHVKKNPSNRISSNLLDFGFLSTDILFCNKTLTDKRVLSWSFFVRKANFWIQSPAVSWISALSKHFSPCCCSRHVDPRADWSPPKEVLFQWSLDHDWPVLWWRCSVPSSSVCLLYNPMTKATSLLKDCLFPCVSTKSTAAALTFFYFCPGTRAGLSKLRKRGKTISKLWRITTKSWGKI